MVSRNGTSRGTPASMIATTEVIKALPSSRRGANTIIRGSRDF